MDNSETISLAKKTFLFHLKDLISTYAPNFLNEFNNFEKVMLTQKNMVVIRQTLQHYIKQVKKAIPSNDKKLKEIIGFWVLRFKVEFPDDKEILFMTLMYLLFQIEDSVNFLIECGKLAENEKDSKIEELKSESMKKLSLLTNIKIIRDEYEAFCQSMKSNNDNKQKNIETPVQKKDEDTKEKIIEKPKQDEIKCESKEPQTLEEKMRLMEIKIAKIDKLESEMNKLKQEVETLKSETQYLKSKCKKYEISKIIKRFFKHICLTNNIPFTSYNYIGISKELQKQNKSSKEIDSLIDYYYTNELDLSFSIDTEKNNQKELSNFISSYQSTFTKYNFNPSKSDLLTYNNIIK